MLIIGLHYSGNLLLLPKYRHINNDNFEEFWHSHTLNVLSESFE